MKISISVFSISITEKIFCILIAWASFCNVGVLVVVESTVFDRVHVKTLQMSEYFMKNQEPIASSYGREDLKTV